MQSVAHPNVILHLDIDYFYAQVEEVLNPELKEKPFGIQQGLSLVTCNYIARSFGIKKWRPLKECLEKCPELVLVNGEDLSRYIEFSKKMSEILHAMIGPTERMGLDEHFMNVTKLIDDQLSKMSEDELRNLHVTGPLYNNEEALSRCKCGCELRLKVGSGIAQQVRVKVQQELKLTCSVGVAHNKLLAKLVGQQNKPNNQTTLAPSSAAEFMLELKELRSIMGIGGKTASRIEELGIATIEELQICEKEKLLKNFTLETSTRLKEMAFGVDTSEVKPSGKSKTVGIEDSCSPFSLRSDAEEMFNELLPRLFKRIENDERIPIAIKVTIRKYDFATKTSSKETRQTSLPPSYSRNFEGKIQLTEGAHEKIMKSVMTLFDQLVNKQKFNINLVGLCFCKFQEQVKGPNSIANFLVKKRKVSEESAENSLSPDVSPSSSKRLKADEQATPLSASEETFSTLSSTIDASVWNELPSDVKRELLLSWKVSKQPPETSTVKVNSLLKNFFSRQ